jgi:transposase
MNFDISHTYFKDASQIRNEVELLDWPPCGSDLNPIEIVWAETKHVMAENWPDPSPASENTLSTF